MQTIFIYTVFAVLAGISSIVSFTGILLYPISRFQRFLIFLYTFLIILACFYKISLYFLPVHDCSGNLLLFCYIYFV